MQNKKFKKISYEAKFRNPIQEIKTKMKFCKNY